MAATPLITFKAGRCTTSSSASSSRKIQPLPTPGYLYLYTGLEDDLIHFCWRPRSVPSTEPEEDLLMIPGDATFTPLVREHGSDDVRSPTNGRIFVLKFSSSGEKRFFWMQSKSQHSSGDADWFSARDQRLGQIVDLLLQGEEVDVEGEVEEIRRSGGNSGGGGGGEEGGEGDDLMDLDRQETGGAGADATGGDAREEGEASREGGADGGRAASSSLSTDANTALQNFLQSIQSGTGSSQQQQQLPDKPYTTLPDLLPAQTTIPYISALTPTQLDHLCTYLPADLFLLAQESSDSHIPSEPTPAAAQAAIEALSPDQKKEILERVLRSPQLRQSLGSLTVALRDGGLPMIGEALRLKVRNGGFVGRGGSSMPMGGGEAVEGFVEGVKKTVEDEKKEEEGGE